jgi:integrase
MAFVTDKEELQPGLIIFRRSDVAHRNWYCRIKLPKADRYKTISLKTPDITTARQMAIKHDARVGFQLESDIPVFNRPFREVAQEYLAQQRKRAARGDVSAGRINKLKAVIEGALDDYIGSTQVHRVGDESWAGYPAWRRENGEGRNARNGVREVTAAMAGKLAAKEAAMRDKAARTRGVRILPPKPKAEPPKSRIVAMISDATIRFEMSIFGAVMNFAIKKRYVPASQRFDDRPKLKTMRRDEFTRAEYSSLHTKARAWIREAPRPSSLWYRTVAYNFVLIMCNTGMRPSEAKNLRWRDIMPAQDKDGREIVVMFVQGKGKSRKLVAPASVGEYLDRVRQIARSKRRVDGKDTVVVGNPAPDEFVFTTITGERAKTLYQALVEALLDYANLHDGPNGVPRSTYSFRHTYATFRLSEGTLYPLRLLHRLRSKTKGHASSEKKTYSTQALADYGTYRAHFTSLVSECDASLDRIMAAIADGPPAPE